MAKKRKSQAALETTPASEPQRSFHPRDMKSFYAWDDDVLVLNILGTPSAKKDIIGKPKGNQLKISVTAAPVGGRATDHMVKWLAKVFEVHRSDIEVVFGRMSIHKQLRITRPKKLLKAIEKEEAKAK